MTTRSFLAVFVISALASAALAGDVDPRFDGRWVGVEYLSTATRPNTNVKTIKGAQTVLVIEDHGKTLGFTQGFAPGRYEVVMRESRRDPHVLIFQMPGADEGKLHFGGRQHCSLRLSADGNTIEEHGTVILTAIDDNGDPVLTDLPADVKYKHPPKGRYASMWATFHRQATN